MATHATIGLIKADRTVDFIYLHQDGHPDFAGRLLVQRYQSAESISGLIALGRVDASRELRKLHAQQAGYEPAELAEPEARRIRRTYPPHHRANSATEYFAQALAMHAHYAYVWNTGRWMVSRRVRRQPDGLWTMTEPVPIATMLEPRF